jgi:hypothetical protein
MFLWGQQGSNVEPSVKRHANLASALEQLASKNERQQSPAQRTLALTAAKVRKVPLDGSTWGFSGSKITTACLGLHKTGRRSKKQKNCYIFFMLTKAP